MSKHFSLNFFSSLKITHSFFLLHTTYCSAHNKWLVDSNKHIFFNILLWYSRFVDLSRSCMVDLYTEISLNSKSLFFICRCSLIQLPLITPYVPFAAVLLYTESSRESIITISVATYAWLILGRRRCGYSMMGWWYPTNCFERTVFETCWSYVLRTLKYKDFQSIISFRKNIKTGHLIEFNIS